ncbi:RsmB/NOP family class I SAM-dependent RNA methyltransferase [Catenovulum sp. SX2]|uniref:RsmB/NOP family class I SAM-dependent RNA methyltransferase n=1 Tax=Catenovulum sp. SX2 TaxID=3398614 RepID=UPI003F87E885
MKRRCKKSPHPQLLLTMARKAIWARWIELEEIKPFDRWLKSQFKLSGNLSRHDKLSISKELFLAVKFAQAADYFESCFIANELVDVVEWDKAWSLTSAKHIQNNEFWFWLTLLQGEEPKVTNGENKRLQWFKSQTGKINSILELWAVRFGIRPSWLPMLTQRAIASGWDDSQLKQFIQQQADTLPVYLRASATTNISQLYKDLNAQDILISKDGDVLSVDGGADVTRTSQFALGQFELQDLASQQIVQAVDVKPGMKVWDCCAGAGGKTLALADRLNNKGSVTSTDIHSYKLDELKKRAKRAEYFNIRTFVWSGDKALDLPNDVKRQNGFDRVLIDAPCTSAGTWRRNPDAKWRFCQQDSDEQIAIQQSILTNAQASVRKNGKLVYATCSWQIAENEAQVSWFLHKFPEFNLESQSLLGGIEQASDTMFVAVFNRTA